MTAGASAPRVLVDELIARLKELGAVDVRQLEGNTENVVFTLLAEPRAAALGQLYRYLSVSLYQ